MTAQVNVLTYLPNNLGRLIFMEKQTPHCKLALLKSFIEAGKVRATASAYQGARELGIHDLEGMCAVVLLLELTHFYKSMTAHADHRIWQDVYQTQTANGCGVYLKLTVIDDVLIVSFKEL
jgi:motility quorum-sensing regulator / GCU-specific mRNA interferase toxin